MHRLFTRNLDKNWRKMNCHIGDWNFEKLREKQQVQSGQLKTKQFVKTILKIKFWRKELMINDGYVNNMKKLLPN